jgi:Phosphotransferase enzyme family
VEYGSSAFRIAAQRRQLACEAALAVAADLELTVDGALIVEDWNNTIIRLGTTGGRREGRNQSLSRCPAGIVGTRVGGECLVFTVELDDAARPMQPDRSPELDATDRRFLLRVVGELRAALGPLGAKYCPLHGSPHGANWHLTADGPLLLDFETACLGPVEWDLSALGADTIAYFPCADLELLDSLRRMRSVCVAAKCWVAPERALELREAAHVHLKLLRGERLD